MHELRKDILLGRWVEVLSESQAPSDYQIPSHDEEDGMGEFLKRTIFGG